MISKTFLSMVSSIIHFWQIAKTRWFTIQILIYYFIYSGIRKVFRKIMQQMFFNETSKYIKIHGPQPLSFSTLILFYIE